MKNCRILTIFDVGRLLSEVGGLQATWKSETEAS